MINCKRNIAISLIGFSLLAFYSCKNYENDSSVFENKIVEISYGTSFGECIKNCRNELKLSFGTSRTLNSSSPNSSLSDEDYNIPKTYTDVISAEKWEQIISKINVDEFFKLPIIYGCPDCTDGGAEWVEIKLKSGETHKVTYEFMKEPKELKSVVALLRVHFNEIIIASK